jgi:hypothetical protein
MLSDVPRTPPRTPPFVGHGSLPYEAFIDALSFLEPSDLWTATHVSRAWRSAALSEPRLWRHLTVSLDATHAIDRASEWLRRAGGGLRELRFVLPEPIRQGISVELHTVCHRLEAVSAQVSQIDGGQWLRKLSLRLLDGSDAFAMRVLWEALRCFLREHAFDNIAELDIKTSLCLVQLSNNFLSTFGHLQTLTFACNVDGEPDLPWDYLHIPTPVVAQSTLRSLCISGPIFFDQFHVPHLPLLETLELRDCRMAGSVLYNLLRSAPNLVHLKVSDLFKTDVDGELDEETMSSMAGFQRPAPITLSKLLSLSCVGEDTPAFWASNDELAWPPAPEIHMPALEEVDLHSVQCLQADLLCRDVDDDGDGASSAAGTTAAADSLQALCMRSYSLHTLLLDFSTISDNTLYEALGFVNNLRRLSVRGTDVSDHIISVLHSLCPYLSELDVRRCPGVSPRTVARCVELIRDGSAGMQKVQRVLMDEPRPLEEACNELEYWNWQAWDWLRWIEVLEEQPLQMERRMSKWSRNTFNYYQWRRSEEQALYRQAQLQALRHLQLQRPAQGPGVTVG